jgi:acetyltransferase
MMLAPFETRLRDGAPVLIREIGPDDAALLRLGFDHLSAESRRFRFFGAIRALSDEQVAAFTSPSDRDHVALGAAIPCGATLDPAGTARYVRRPSRPGAAEFALTIVDRHQRRGLGSLLLGTLVAVARANAISRLVGYVMRDNDAMRALMEDMGACRDPGPDRGVFRVTLDTDRSLPDTPAGRAARSAAAAARFAATP